jgi:hypothetical protein
MNRRDFLKRLGLATAGIVAADQLEIIERLGWKRRFFQGFTATPAKLFVHKEFALGFMVTREMLEDDMSGSIKELAEKMNVRHSFLDDTYIFTPKNTLSAAGKADHSVLPREPGLISQGVMAGSHKPMAVLRPIRASALVGG